MNDEFGTRLSRISTVWDQLRNAQTGTTEQASQAVQLLIERYGGAVYRYLLAAVRDTAVAQDLRQEFALRLVRRDFHRAAPEKGRFRHYVKAVLFNLVRGYRRDEAKRRATGHAGDIEIADADSSEQELWFHESWRDQLLARAWDALQQAQPRYYRVLRFRTGHPDLSSAEMAERLASVDDQKLTATGVRQLLLRARTRFAELLVEQVAHSLHSAARDDVEDELADLNLLEYCRPALVSLGR